MSVSRTAVPGTTTQAGFVALFTNAAGGYYQTIANVRDFPAVGTPANIVKVPVYGQAQSQSVGAQADAPDLEVTINYVPTQWIKTGNAYSNTSASLGDAVGDGVSKVFQFAMASAQPATQNANTAGLGSVPNTVVYFVGRIESILVQPARDDAATATVALSIQSDFYGPFTVT